MKMEMYSVHLILLQLFWHVPFGEIIAYTGCLRLYIMYPFMHGRQAVSIVKKCIGRFISYYFMYFFINSRPFFPVKRGPALFEQPVHLFVFIRHKIKLPFPVFRGVPYIITI